MKDEDVKKLVSQCVRGSKESYGPVVRHFQRKIYNLSLHYLGTAQDAEDASADVFIKAYRSLGTFDPAYAFSTWLYKIAVNHSLGILRRRKLERDYLEQQVAAPADTHLETEAPEALFFRGVDRELMAQALTALPENYRTALMLKYSQDLPYSEIARVMDLPVNTVASLILRGKKELRKWVANATGNINEARRP